MNLTIKNIPENVVHTLKKTAAASRRSMNSEVIRILEDAAAEAEWRRKARLALPDLERFVASLPPMPDSTDLIREDRDNH